MTPKWDAKPDDCQAAMVVGLRAMGFQVVLTHRLGSGFPDMAVWRGHDLWLIEAKGLRGRLTPKERAFWTLIYDGPGGIVRPASSDRWVELAMAWPAPWAVAAMRVEFVEAETGT